MKTTPSPNQSLLEQLRLIETLYDAKSISDLNTLLHNYEIIREQAPFKKFWDKLCMVIDRTVYSLTYPTAEFSEFHVEIQIGKLIELNTTPFIP